MAFFKKPGEEEEEAGKSVEAKFKAVEDTVKVLTEGQTKSTEVITSMAETITAMNKRFEREDAERLNREKEAREAARPKAKTAEEQFEDFANDPAAAMRDAMAPALKISLITSGKVMRQEVLGDKEYYHGEIKKKVDAMLDSEPNLQNVNNPAFIHNCYKVVLADHIEDINTGKLKKAASLYSFSDASTSGDRNHDSNAKPSVDYTRGNKNKSAADAFGLTDEDLVNAAKEGAIHGLEVVA